jgi:hypothetical protein
MMPYGHEPNDMEGLPPSKAPQTRGERVAHYVLATVIVIMMFVAYVIFRQWLLS